MRFVLPLPDRDKELEINIFNPCRVDFQGSYLSPPVGTGGYSYLNSSGVYDLKTES